MKRRLGKRYRVHLFAARSSWLAQLLKSATFRVNMSVVSTKGALIFLLSYCLRLRLCSEAVVGACVVIAGVQTGPP